MWVRVPVIAMATPTIATILLVTAVLLDSYVTVDFRDSQRFSVNNHSVIDRNESVTVYFGTFSTQVPSGAVFLSANDRAEVTDCSNGFTWSGSANPDDGCMMTCVSKKVFTGLAVFFALSAMFWSAAAPMMDSVTGAVRAYRMSSGAAGSATTCLLILLSLYWAGLNAPTHTLLTTGTFDDIDVGIRTPGADYGICNYESDGLSDLANAGLAGASIREKPGDPQWGNSMIIATTSLVLFLLGGITAGFVVPDNDSGYGKARGSTTELRTSML